jgi:hypothetical protein
MWLVAKSRRIGVGRMVVVRKKRRVVVEDDEPEQAPSGNGKIIIARTISRDDVPKGRAPGARNPEYEKLIRRLIRLEVAEKAAVIPVSSKTEKVKIREGVRKPLRVRGYDLTAITDYDDELGEVLMLFATKREEEEPEDEVEDDEPEAEDDEIEDEEDEEEEETPAPVVRRKKRRG